MKRLENAAAVFFIALGMTMLGSSILVVPADAFAQYANQCEFCRKECPGANCNGCAGTCCLNYCQNDDVCWAQCCQHACNNDPDCLAQCKKANAVPCSLGGCEFGEKCNEYKCRILGGTLPDCVCVKYYVLGVPTCFCENP